MEVKLTQPLLPLRDIVVFPSMVIPLFVGRDKSITALNEVMKAFITSFKAVIDLSLPTNSGITMLGNTTMSLNGNKGCVNLTSIE